MVAYTLYFGVTRHAAVPPFVTEFLDSTESAVTRAGSILRRWSEYDFVEIVCDGQLVATVRQDTVPTDAAIASRI